MRFPFFKPKSFDPDFPIIPLYATEDEARKLLSQYSAVSEEDPETDRTIAQKLLVAASAETRISVGIWDGRVRFTNYRTERFNKNDEMKGRKLSWFVDYYGGADEFGEPMNTGYMIFLRNPTKKITIVFGLHMGPVRVIDQDPEHWPDTNDQKPNQSGAANRRPAEQDGSGILSATVAADRAFPAAVAELSLPFECGE